MWRGSAVCGQFLIGLHTQHFGDLPPPSPATPRDVLIANFGQWNAAKEHHTFARYRGAVDRWFATTWPAPAAGAMRVWASTVPTVRNDPWVRATQDWRTLSRLSLFNEYADAAAAAHGWIVLDSWNLTLPFRRGNMLPDNFGLGWTSDLYGNEVVNHVQGACQIYEHSGNLTFLREAYSFYSELYKDGFTANPFGCAPRDASVSERGPVHGRAALSGVACARVWLRQTPSTRPPALARWGCGSARRPRRPRAGTIR